MSLILSAFGKPLTIEGFFDKKATLLDFYPLYIHALHTKILSKTEK